MGARQGASRPARRARRAVEHATRGSAGSAGAGVSRENTPLALLGDRYGLDWRQSEQLETIIEMLGKHRHAPTAVRDRSDAIDVHMADSLVALELEPLHTARTIADLGAGAGFPGLPLAVALPDCDFSLIDSQERRCGFIGLLARTAGITNARAVWTRAEEWSLGREANDVVLARALGPAPVVLEYAAPLLRPGGLLIDWRGRRDAGLEASALRAAKSLGLERQEIRHVEPFTGAAAHHLHLYLKVRETPDRFPRRAGIARKRPLGTSDRDRR